MKLLTPIIPAILLLAAGSLTGCGVNLGAEDPYVLSHRSQYLLADEPSGAVSISEAKEGIESQPDVVVVGRIAAGEFDPWEEGRATFNLSEAASSGSGHDHAAGHNPDNCPFCEHQSSQGASTAIVQLLDNQGEVLQIDARQLLGVEKNQVVVVRGQAHVNDLDVLVVSADGIYVKK